MSTSDDENSKVDDNHSSDEESSITNIFDQPVEYLLDESNIDISKLENIFTEDLYRMHNSGSDSDDRFFITRTNDDLFLNDPLTECTYKDGYMKRQNLYCCIDCNKSNNQVSAVCMACAIYCHRKHNIQELYSKRNFRCDCGNDKFNSFNCKLIPNKETFNSKNIYDDNFRGVYCVCKQSCDMNNSQKDDFMIQCIICEDWYHSKHLDIEPPRTPDGLSDYDEFICFLCCNNYAYLSKYSKFTDKYEMNQQLIKMSYQQNRLDYNPNDHCIMKNIPFKLPYKSLYFHSGWRNLLCKCDACLKTFKHHKHEFLFDPDDIASNEGESFDVLRAFPNTPTELQGESQETTNTFSYNNTNINSNTTNNNIISCSGKETQKCLANNNDSNNNSTNNDDDDDTTQLTVSNNDDDNNTTNLKLFMKKFTHEKRPPVNVHESDEMLKEFQHKKRPKYDDKPDL